MNITLNEKAPVISKKSITVSAPVNVVWEVLTDINSWPAWQKNVTKSELQGELREGAVFKWKADGISFKSKIHTNKENALFGWTGKTWGAYAVHNWFFSKNGDYTIVKAEESLQGVLPYLFKSYFQKNLNTGMEMQLHELKQASERKYNQLLNPAK